MKAVALAVDTVYAKYFLGARNKFNAELEAGERMIGSLALRPGEKPPQNSSVMLQAQQVPIVPAFAAIRRSSSLGFHATKRPQEHGGCTTQISLIRARTPHHLSHWYQVFPGAPCLLRAQDVVDSAISPLTGGVSDLHDTVAAMAI